MVQKAMELALEGKFGVLTVIKNGKLDSVSLEDVVGNNTKIGAVSGNTAESNIRKVTMDHDLVKTARDIEFAWEIKIYVFFSFLIEPK